MKIISELSKVLKHSVLLKKDHFSHLFPLNTMLATAQTETTRIEKWKVEKTHGTLEKTNALARRQKFQKHKGICSHRKRSLK